MEIVEYVDLGLAADELRQKLAQEALNYGFPLLAQTIQDSDDIEEVMSAAELDLIEMGIKPNEAALGVQAGCFAYKFAQILRGIANLALQPEVEGDQ